MNDATFMRRAITLASRARGMTSPNPMVGAVLVKNGRIIAEDYHKSPGTPHAESLVIEKAGEKALSSTLYVNLEPCCHTDKRTPPCTKTIIRAGIKKVFVAMADPNPKVSGKGMKEIREAGIEVVSGILEEKAKRLNESYIKYITTGKPFVILKVAMTLDGKIATPEGQSRWITGEKARRVVHGMRSGVDAIMTAIGTVKADDPELTARVQQRAKGIEQRAEKPMRIVIDPGLEIPFHAKILRLPPDSMIVARDIKTKEDTKKKKAKYLLKSGINILFFKEKLDLKWLIEKLGAMGITSLMIEGGSSLNAHALEDRIVDKVAFFIAPKIMGGRESFPSVGGSVLKRLEDAYKLRDVTIKRVGDDILVEGYL